MSEMVSLYSPNQNKKNDNLLIARACIQGENLFTEFTIPA